MKLIPSMYGFNVMLHDSYEFLMRMSLVLVSYCPLNDLIFNKFSISPCVLSHN